MAKAIDKQTMLDLIIEAKRMDPEAGPFSEWLAEYLVDHLPTLTTPSEWVSVEQRLPEVGQDVLVYWWNTSQKAEHFELTHYDGDHWFLLDNTERPWIVVVAWMPLPAPPDRRPPEGENHHG